MELIVLVVTSHSDAVIQTVLGIENEEVVVKKNISLIQRCQKSNYRYRNSNKINLHHLFSFNSKKVKKCHLVSYHHVYLIQLYVAVMYHCHYLQIKLKLN